MEKQILFSPLTKDQVKEKYEKQFGHEIIEIVELNRWINQQQFMILEWCNNHEYSIRNVYVHLRPRADGSMQRFGQGSGQYPLLFDKETDLGVAKILFQDRYERLVKEDRTNV